MKMKNKISITLILLIGLIGAGFFVTQIGNEVDYIHIDYVVDVTDDRALVGIADNVFIGKVIAQPGISLILHHLKLGIYQVFRHKPSLVLRFWKT